MSIRRLIIVIAAVLGLSRTAPCADSTDFFEAKVRPVLVQHCQKCHGPEKQRGGLRLDSRAGWQTGGDNGPAIVPGKPDESLLIKAIRHAGDKRQMPPSGKLAAQEIAALTEWVKQGAIDPRDGGPTRLGGMTLDAAKKWWSFQPIRRPHREPPALAGGVAGDPIDAFIAERLAAKKLAMSRPADRRTLIRRATYDLTGLPPTPEEVDAFLNDPSPDAFARVVERLLASPAYGERWGRHWLDLVRYADSAGENSDHPLPHAWRYRNWVIDAFNRDQPYDQFLREQIAGDLLDGPAEQRSSRIVATGFLAIARRFGHDSDKDMHLTHEDVIDTLGKTTLGLTIGCARCHDHKYDPISSRDYYALYGICESTRFPFAGCEAKQQPRDLVPLGKPPSKEVAFAVAEGTAKDARLHQRGDPEKLGPVVQRRWLEVLGGQMVTPQSGSGRLQLAGWLTDSKNPLTARVMVNRIWLHHFGKGLVRTPNDFGTRGLPPTHPELLDWLASEFVDSGWSVKAMHRRIMLTAAYQQASAARPECLEGDPNNDCYWRFDRRRISAEELRDSLLQVSGQLDRAPAGPHPFPAENTWNFTQHNPFSAIYETNKRSVYLVSLRNRRHPFLGLFDGADPNATTPQRQVTTVPTQALYFLNDPFYHAQADKFAARLLMKPDETARLDELIRLAFQRVPTSHERETLLKFLQAYSVELTSSPTDQRPKIAWAALVRTLLASNEFLTLD